MQQILQAFFPVHRREYAADNGIALLDIFLNSYLQSRRLYSQDFLLRRYNK